MRPIKKGSTDQSVVIRIIDSTDGTPETAVEHNTSGIDLWYRREGATKTSITEAALAALDSAHSDGGIEHIGDGYYRLDLPDAAVATGANGVAVGGTVTGMVVIGCYVHLTDYDPQDTVRLGLTALPNAAADAAGGLPISDAGGLDLDAKIGALTFTVAGKVDANTTHAAGTAWGSGAITAASIATGAITNAKFAAGAIDAAAIANGAIDAATFAADVDAEILSYLVDDATRIDASALNTLSSHDPGATLGTSTLTQTQVTGGAYALNSASFAFNAALDLTTTQKASVNTEADTALSDVGLTTTITGRIDAAISTRSTLTQTQVTGGAYALNSASFAFNSGLDFTTTQKAATLARVTLVDTTTTNTDMITAAGIRTAVGLASANLDTQLGNIVTDTNELQTDWANGGRLDLLLDATLADTNELQTDWANGGRLDLLLDATLADTNELQTDWANGGRLDVIVDAILADTGTDGVIVASFTTAAKAEIESEVDDALGGGTGTALTAIPWNASWDAEVQSEVIDALQETVPDSVPADGSRPNIQQAVRMILQALIEGGISGTTWTVKKEDGSTTLLTVSLDSATTPTSKTRSG